LKKVNKGFPCTSLKFNQKDYALIERKYHRFHNALIRNLELQPSK